MQLQLRITNVNFYALNNTSRLQVEVDLCYKVSCVERDAGGSLANKLVEVYTRGYMSRINSLRRNFDLSSPSLVINVYLLGSRVINYVNLYHK